MMNKLKLSTLPHTWIFDVDGTIVKHNGYKTDGFDTLLEGVHNLFLNIPQEDKIILLTGRNNSCRSNLELFLKQHNLRYDCIIFDVPLGERILINDKKPGGLNTAYSINKNRDEALSVSVIIDKDL